MAPVLKYETNAMMRYTEKNINAIPKIALKMSFWNIFFTPIASLNDLATLGCFFFAMSSFTLFYVQKYTIFRRKCYKIVIFFYFCTLF